MEYRMANKMVSCLTRKMMVEKNDKSHPNIQNMSQPMILVLMEHLQISDIPSLIYSYDPFYDYSNSPPFLF